MGNSLISVPSYVSGKTLESTKELRRSIPDITGKSVLEVHDVNKWGLVAAINSASRTQNQLESIPLEKICRVLSKSMDYYFVDESKCQVVVRLTGSPITFVRESMESIKAWCKDLSPYLSCALAGDQVEFGGSAPVIVILPSNSELETPYVLTQTLLSRNAAIVRPSSLGASSYSLLEFVSALNKGLDEIDDISLEPLRSAISVANIESRDYLDNLSIDGWNYIFFGDNNTVKAIESSIRERCYPRKTIGYGTGLSMSIAFDDHNLEETITNVIESVIVNVGNECDSTDIIYIKEDIYDNTLEILEQEAEKRKSGDPFNPDMIGLVQDSNADYIQGELLRRGKLKFLKTSDVGSSELFITSPTLFQTEPNDRRRLIHTSIIPLNEYETAMEYPGPIASVRPFHDLEDLQRLVEKDLRDNSMQRNLVTSVFSRDESSFYSLLPLLKSHTVKWNKPTHRFNYLLPHQGLYLIRELSTSVFVDKG